MPHHTLIYNSTTVNHTLTYLIITVNHTIAYISVRVCYALVCISIAVCYKSPQNIIGMISKTSALTKLLKIEKDINKMQ